MIQVNEFSLLKILTENLLMSIQWLFQSGYDRLCCIKKQPQMSYWLITAKFCFLFMQWVYHRLAEVSAHCGSSQFQANGASIIANTSEERLLWRTCYCNDMVWPKMTYMSSTDYSFCRTNRLAPTKSGRQEVPSYRVLEIRQAEISGKQHQWPSQW